MTNKYIHSFVGMKFKIFMAILLSQVFCAIADETILYSTTFSLDDPVINRKINYLLSVYDGKMIVSYESNSYQTRTEYSGFTSDDLAAGIFMFCTLSTDLRSVDLPNRIWPSIDPARIKSDGQLLIWFRIRIARTYTYQSKTYTSTENRTLAFYQYNSNGQVVLVMTDNSRDMNTIVLDLNQAWELSIILNNLKEV
jgi:hypothetical protein